VDDRFDVFGVNFDANLKSTNVLDKK